ncbi:ATP-dependent DNA helicase PIF1-like isoform X2 [Rhinatrema bivittatum]|uniref:ATP-dependent DNA helicase PIF1-like isoform X2 n=1 Tax=Rhinatrema bivittatum TaxID=194408 RepID=UPI001125D2FA|nr:ATP-dependent DNA helicase PIF1-like isoform X2 [Rhinatrema bivittatum]
MLRHHVATDLQCSITIEHLTASGQSPKRQLIRNAALTLGRNEFRELVLRVSDGKLPQSFVLRQIRVFTRFVRDGKSSIQLISENIQLLFANCPPEKLKMFMKTLLIKHKAAESVAEPITDRTRLLSCLPRSFETISPVQIRDVQQANEQQAKANSETPKKVKRCWNNSISGFSNYGQAKRKRSESSENCQTVDVKALKKPALTMPPRLKLSLEQSLILSAVMDRKNVFFTGTGKSYLLKKIVGSLPPESTYATASTGVAACHVGGTTLHSFAGIGSGKAPLDQCIGLANRPGVRQHWLSCQHLIIDEISMVEGEFFDKLEAVARAVRRREDPFGGIHLIISGDFLQLPPVMKTSEKTKFCFQAKSWKKCIQLNMELTEVRRQTEKTFISLLQAIRLGMCPEEVAHQLMKTATNKIEQDGILATRLCTHKDDVELTNVRRLQQLPGEIHTFEALDSDPVLVKTIDAHSPVAQFIQLKKGAQVMLTKNLDVSRGLVNGARGVVVGFQPEGKGMPNVRFLCGVTEVIKPECWIFKGRNGVLLSRKQLPLKLAWAISIHKSQGMSLDCVEISLARVFESGQAYVALSRARSLQGLRVMDFDPKVVRADPHVLQFYSRLRKQCLLAQGEHVTKNQPSSVL